MSHEMSPSVRARGGEITCESLRIAEQKTHASLFGPEELLASSQTYRTYDPPTKLIRDQDGQVPGRLRRQACDGDHILITRVVALGSQREFNLARRISRDCEGESQGTRGERTAYQRWHGVHYPNGDTTCTREYT